MTATPATSAPAPTQAVLPLNDVWTRSRITKLIQTNDTALERAILAIHRRQTPSERASKTTKVDNAQGFSAGDAFLMSKFAEDLTKYGSLTVYKRNEARRRMPKYWRQLLEDAKEKGKSVTFNPKK